MIDLESLSRRLSAVEKVMVSSVSTAEFATKVIAAAGVEQDLVCRIVSRLGTALARAGRLPPGTLAGILSHSELELEEGAREDAERVLKLFADWRDS